MKAPLHQKQKYDGRRFLDLKLAQEIVPEKPAEAPGLLCGLDLTTFTGIAPEAIRYLAQFHFTWVDFAISHMGKALAQEIAAWTVGDMSFRNGMETTSEALVCFRLCPAMLSFGNISDALDLEAAKALSTCGGALLLTVDCLEPEVAALLANHLDLLEIGIRQPVALASIRALSQHLGGTCVLYLNQLVTPELMAALHDSPKKRVIDLTRIAHHSSYQTSLRLCDEHHYSEMLASLDLTQFMSIGPIR